MTGVLQSTASLEVERGLLEEACVAADGRGARVLLSYSRAIEPRDTIGLYRACRVERRETTYWEQPSRGSAVVTAGALRVHTLRGEGRFGDAARAWRALSGSAVTNRRSDLVAVAGFAFAAGERARHWASFGDGALVVPEFVYRRSGDQATATFNLMVQPGQSAGALQLRLAHLLSQPAASDRPGDAAVDGFDETVTADAWRDAVRALTSSIERGRVEKVVLAREVTVRARNEIDETTLIARLREGYGDCTVFSFRRGGACFIGATPERLVQVERGSVRATCLAGSAPRGATADDDEAAGTALLGDAKERREHRLVVQMIAEALRPLCRRIDVPSEPRLMRMPNVQHLYTPVEGTLAGDVGALELVERLHPTPAVGGMPRTEALRLIQEHEPFDRGWYAGPIGWVDANGDGEFSVAIRSALIAGLEARLYAGCGIVAGSNPEREYDESTMKLRPMLWALNQQ
ncbi:MAG TPA: isochorismate synthase [Dehalococcoidia bacterium]|nr:isochorismate synthase [Dehalococcoidia bacterium]